MKKDAFEHFDFFPISQNEAVLEEATKAAFSRLSFQFSKEHLESLISVCLSPDSSDNDRYVCACMLENARVSAKGTFPICQDTGIATAFGWAKKGFLINGNESEQILLGAKKIYDEKKLRFSTFLPTSFFDEQASKDNMPPQISIFADSASLAPLPDFAKNAPADSLALLFVAKGGGSSNKTTFIQGTKADLSLERFSRIMEEQIKKLGTSACPPYNIAVVAGGLSPEQNLLTLKLATAGAYSNMTFEPNDSGFRDKNMENLALAIAKNTGFGSQFGGSAFALNATVVRLPRHSASCPISFGVSCSAHRNLMTIVTKDGFFLEKTVENPEKLPHFSQAVLFSKKETGQTETKINTESGIKSVLENLKALKVGSRILLSGKILVARDAAHAKWKALLESGKELPDYTKKYPICYAGPARTPKGAVIGSFGPTTAGRMDSYADDFMSRGASLVTLAKGNRSKTFTNACKKYEAVYLGTPGGIAALIASEYIISERVVDYEELGMEAVRIVEVKDLPCFILTSADGEDFYGENINGRK